MNSTGLTFSDWISIASVFATVVAIVFAPIIALYVSGRLQQRADSRAAKVKLFSTLIGLRHDLFTSETVEAINSIDAVFVDDKEVREVWSQLIGLMNDPNANNPAGYAMRDAKRRDLLLAMAESLGWKNKITSADLMRVYQPTFMAEEIRKRLIEQKIASARLEKEAKDLGVDISALQLRPSATIGAQPTPSANVANQNTTVVTSNGQA